MNEPIKLNLRSFESQVLYFNGMYKLPIAPYPTIMTEADYQRTRKVNEYADHPRDYFQSRLQSFKTILNKEVTEIDDAILHAVDKNVEDIDLLVEMADLLGDIVVYCTSEAARYGIPLHEVLPIIMDSNFSKLGADGQPIYDADGKVQKGPFYWKPEPKIKILLEQYISDTQPKANDGV